ncbi:uncharacterized protein M6B38_373150 [Iris pallida]|uniref:SWIM-type domain-containing protein n=1 Tax=Iris pallida TaxID=29817 RepID=A0AAX6GCA9_IRIPA|nr:uncharacterized protein M6B38_373150 [Iris pallida]
MQSIWSRRGSLSSLEELFQDFVDQTSFMQYFKENWVPKLDMWLSTMKSLPLASQESCGAIEAYHLKLKLKIYDDSHLDALQRVDWLVHKLTTELHSNYWLDLYADESGSFQTVKEEYIYSTSWHRALQVPDDAVSFDEKECLFAKVVSQKDTTQLHVVWNPGSEFSFCDCSWSLQGNICKHIIKVNMLCQNQKNCPPSLSYQSFQQILLNLWRKPIDDSLTLDQSVAWATQIQDKIQRLVELTSTGDIANVVSNLPLKWVSRKERTVVGKPSDNTLSHPPLLMSDAKRKVVATKKKNRKRKRLCQIKSF